MSGGGRACAWAPVETAWRRWWSWSCACACVRKKAMPPVRATDPGWLAMTRPLPSPKYGPVPEWWNRACRPLSRVSRGVNLSWCGADDFAPEQARQNMNDSCERTACRPVAEGDDQLLSATPPNLALKPWSRNRVSATACHQQSATPTKRGHAHAFVIVAARSFPRACGVHAGPGPGCTRESELAPHFGRCRGLLCVCVCARGGCEVCVCVCVCVCVWFGESDLVVDEHEGDGGPAHSGTGRSMVTQWRPGRVFLPPRTHQRPRGCEACVRFSKRNQETCPGSPFVLLLAVPLALCRRSPGGTRPRRRCRWIPSSSSSA